MNEIDGEKELLKLLKSKGYKKISINVTKETLNLIDEYVKMAGINRSLVINSILQTGFSNYLSLVEDSIKKALNKNELEDKKDRPRFIKFQKDLKIFRDKNIVLKSEKKK